MRRERRHRRPRQRSLRGWGYAGEELTEAERAGLAAVVANRFPDHDATPRPPAAGAPALPAPRLRVPDALAGFCTTDDITRALHARGSSYADAVAAHHGRFDPAPDVVATPRDEREVRAVLEWCAGAGTACIPYGGGTSVVGGVRPAAGDRPVVTLQTRAMNRVLDVDSVSRAARIEAGVLGPDLEDQLRPHGFTLRFFPQSFELSTLGGWIATRAGGHFATRLTHIDDVVESATAVTPSGLWSSRRLPASGAGPSPDRLLLGSEGILGVITQAWVRVVEQPRWRASASVRFASFGAGAQAVRTIVQAGFAPANCRLLDRAEALLNGVGDGGAAVLLLGWESAHAPIGGEATDALALARDAGGRCPEGVARRDSSEADAGTGGGQDAASRWRRSFLRAPYLRDGLIALGMIIETFETAVTWDRLGQLRAAVVAEVRAALREVCGDGVVTCRLTHAYPDGAAPYFTVIAPGRRGAEVAQWDDIKAAASEALRARPSPTTTRSDATTGSGTTGSAPRRSPRRSRRPSEPWTPPGCSIPAC